MRRVLLLVILSTIVAGCMFNEVKKGTPEEYTLPGINNTIIYYINASSVQVVEHVMNRTTVMELPGDNGDIENAIAVDSSGKNVTFNVSEQVIFGKRFVRFDFDSNFSGFVAYTYNSGSQDFFIPLIKNKSVMVVLPQNYTTGSRFLGIARPEPDNITTDTSGREVLVWEHPYPEHRFISVKYYPENAPRMLSYLAVFFLITSLLIAGYYYYSIRVLKKKRMLVEEK